MRRHCSTSALSCAKSSSCALRYRCAHSFFRSFWGAYWVIDLDQDYAFAVVCHPGRDYLWILSRTPTLEPATYDGIVERLQAQGYETERLVKTAQPSP